jgi:hypothetical protein
MIEEAFSNKTITPGTTTTTVSRMSPRGTGDR